MPISTATGALLTAGGAWLNSSSRERKEHIQALSGAQALQALAELRPVTYNYKVDAEEKHVGFIAEDVPELLASKDRKSLSALDIVAVLTKAVQEQKQMVESREGGREQKEPDGRRTEAGTGNPVRHRGRTQSRSELAQAPRRRRAKISAALRARPPAPAGAGRACGQVLRLCPSSCAKR